MLFQSLVKLLARESPEGEREGKCGGCLSGVVMNVFLVEGKGHL